MVAELRRRGDARRESGAFLLSPRLGDGRTITRVVYLDDLDPHCLTGTIRFDGIGYGRLWDICDRDRLRLVADVHTHPGPSVAQSSIDRDNPMLARVGHLALIIPNFARDGVKPREVGIHEYLGDEGWRSFLDRDAAQALYVGRFV